MLLIAFIEAGVRSEYQDISIPRSGHCNDVLFKTCGILMVEFVLGIRTGMRQAQRTN